MSAINDRRLTELGLVFWGAEGYAYREKKTDWAKPFSINSGRNLRASLTDKQKSRFDYEIDPTDAASRKSEACQDCGEPCCPRSTRLTLREPIGLSSWAHIEMGSRMRPDCCAQWPENGPPVLWTVPVGDGFAGPVIAGDKVYLLDRENGARCSSSATT